MAQQDNSNLWAAAKGAFVATIVLLAFLLLSVLCPTDPPVQNGAIRGAVSTFTFSPIFFIIMFVYFLILSSKPGRPLKRAIVVQTVLLTPLALFIFYVASKEAGILIGAANGMYTYIFLGLILGLGAWAWSR